MQYGPFSLQVKSFNIQRPTVVGIHYYRYVDRPGFKSAQYLYVYAVTFLHQDINLSILTEELIDISFVNARCIANYIDKRVDFRSEEHTSELQSRENLVCR